MASVVSLIALEGVQLIQRGDDLVEVLEQALQTSGQLLQDGDILILAQKIVSKSEGRQVRLSGIEPSARALELAQQTGKDARIVELVLSESNEVVRSSKGVLIVEHRLGFVMANAGVDQSNLEDGDDSALLLPLDPDGFCRDFRDALRKRYDVDVAVIVNDSHGRVAGMPSLLDLRGKSDLFGRKLMITEVGYADEIAAAASLVMGQAGEGVPIVLCRGLRTPSGSGSARDLIRSRQMDLFR
jgi:coenzyme F420-0:L-glutamate ligase / coenzyme F420-1:gamma-L-glutamate ligase